jgi:CRISPR-associated protein Csd2
MVYQDHIPKDLQSLYEVHDYRHAAAILAKEFPTEFQEIYDVLMEFRFTEKDITDAGGNESRIPKIFSTLLRPKEWKEIKLNAKLVVDEEEMSIDSHKIDYCKGRVAFDLEWNSKDQTFDRDLYAFRTFFDYNKISVAVLVTRSTELNTLFKKLDIMTKYGASTTHMGKLLPRLKAGRNGGCPVLVFGITDKLLK